MTEYNGLQKYDIINSLCLTPHPEGGYFKETKKSKHSSKDGRKIYSIIYFLIDHESPSMLHKFGSDEIWTYHYGNSDIAIKGFNLSGLYFEKIIGNNAMCWESTIEKNTWFGAEVTEQSDDYFALVSCICFPAFDFNEFELGKREELSNSFPQHSKLIEKFTKG